MTPSSPCAGHLSDDGELSSGDAARPRPRNRDRPSPARPGERDHGRDGSRVGHTTLIEGESVRTGVTVVVPPPEPLFAGAHTINGNGELTGLEWIRDSGMLTTPIGLTNTHSVGVVRDALVAAAQPGEWDWSLPVVGETWDGFLNDINGFHVKPEHVFAALASAHGGPVEEGSVGGGTGMVCHGFKGGIGTASRVVEDGWMVGVLVQANHGRRCAAARERRPGRRARSARTRAAPGERRRRGRRLDHRPDRDRRAAASGAVRAPRAAGRLRDRAYGRDGRALERRLRALLRDRQPGARRRKSPSCRCEC